MELTAAAAGCPVCRSEARQTVTQRNDLEVVRCRNCGQGYVWPAPAPATLAGFYDRHYYQGGHGSLGFVDYDALAPARRRMFGRHLDRIERTVSRGRVLDVGCATGDFLDVARQRGWDVLGVDPSPARDQAVASGLPIVGMTIHDADVAPGSVDLITFWDVLEHIGNPGADLDHALTLLSPGGVVAATVPDAGTFAARVSGARWFGYKTAGEHLQFFTPRTLARTFANAGFEMVVNQPVAWSCTVAFLTDRAALYLGPVGRGLNRVLLITGAGNAIVDVPQVNRFGLARRVGASSKRAARACL